MARLHDHFHLIYLLPGQPDEPDAPTGELEGGWTGYPDDWGKRTPEQQRSYWEALGVAWGMPEGATIKKVWLAG